MKFEEKEATLEAEVSEDDYNAMLGGLYNLKTAEDVLKPKLESKIKAETLNGVDAQITEILAEGLSAEELEDVKAEDKTAGKMRKAVDFYKAKTVPSSKKEEPELVKSLTKALEDAKAELRAKDESHAAKLEEVEATHKTHLFNSQLEVRINGRADVAADKKTDRHFIPNFRSDLNELLGKEAIKIDPDTHKVLKEDGTPYFSKTNDEVSLDDLLGRVVKEYGYEKKSETPIRQTFETGGGDAVGFKTTEERMANARQTMAV